MQHPNRCSTAKSDKIDKEQANAGERPEELVIARQREPARHARGNDQQYGQDLVLASTQTKRRKREGGAEEEQHWPDDADDAPRRFIFNDAIRDDRADAVN